MRKGIVLMIALVIVVSSFVFALDKRGDIFGDGQEYSPYCTEDCVFGVLEDCSVRVFDVVTKIWNENSGNIQGSGSSDDPYRISGENYGIICVPGSYVDKVVITIPDVQRGKTEATEKTSTSTEPPQTPSESTPSAAQFGCKTNRCKEIDEVWRSIQGLMKNFAAKFPDRIDKIFDKILGWVLFNDVYSPKEIPAQTSTKDIQDVKPAAQAILDSPNVKFWDGLSTGSDREAFKDFARTGKTIVPSTNETVTPSLQMMKALVEMARDGPIMINALTGGSHSRGSSHYQGLAVDLDIRTGNTAQIVAIARKYGGTRNSETNHIHLDFPGSSVSSTTTMSSICVATEGTSYQRALLDTIAWAEGTNEKYNVMFGGRQFTGYSAHPVITGQMPPDGFPFNSGTSTAAGRYQFLKRTYDDLKRRGYFSTGFGPQEQDKAAINLIERVRGLSAAELERLVGSNSLTEIWNKLKEEWTSLPTKNNQDLNNIFNSCLRTHNQ